MVLLPIRSHHNLVVASWDELYYALLIPVRVLSFQLSCYSCFQLATIVKFLAAKILLQLWQQIWSLTLREERVG